MPGSLWLWGVLLQMWKRCALFHCPIKTELTFYKMEKYIWQSGEIHYTRTNTLCNLNETKCGGGVHSSTAQSRLSSAEAGGGSARTMILLLYLKFLNLPLVCAMLKAHIWSKVLLLHFQAICAHGPCVIENRTCVPNQVLERHQIGCRVSYMLHYSHTKNFKAHNDRCYFLKCSFYFYL